MAIGWKFSAEPHSTQKGKAPEGLKTALFKVWHKTSWLRYCRKFHCDQQFLWIWIYTGKDSGVYSEHCAFVNTYSLLKRIYFTLLHHILYLESSYLLWLQSIFQPSLWLSGFCQCNCEQLNSCWYINVGGHKLKSSHFIDGKKFPKIVSK